jgi:hypothetical protein
MTIDTGFVDYDDLIKLGFVKDNFGVPYAVGCTVTLELNDGSWQIDIRLPNGKAVGICQVRS